MKVQCNLRSFGVPIILGTILTVVALLLATVVNVSAQYQVRKPAGTVASIQVTNPPATTWEKGKRYEITWTSTGIRGSVKIDLVDQQGKVTSLAPRTMNSGKYGFTLMTNVTEGDYKIRVSTTDGKTVGESTGTVHVGKPAGTFQPMGTTQPAVGTQQSTFTPAGSGIQTGTTPPVTGGTTVQSGALTEAGSATADAAELAEGSGVTVVQAGMYTPIQVPESELGRLEIAEEPNLNASQHVTPADPQLEVTRPNADDFWVAGASVPIRWNSTDIDGPIKIDLVHAVSTQQYDFFPVAESTPNNGAFQYTVPANLNCNWRNFYLQVATVDDAHKAFSPAIDVYTEPIDMTCQIQGIGTGQDFDYYVVYAEKDKYLKFNVLVRNNGTAPSITVQTVRLILIKEPEEIVMAQEEFGFGGVAPRLWYKTPNPRKFNIWHKEFYHGTTVNLKSGAYRVEIDVDPLNLMGEDPAMRDDNRTVVRFNIR